MGTVLFILFLFIIVGLIVYYFRSQEFHGNVDTEVTKVEDVIKSKIKS